VPKSAGPELPRTNFGDHLCKRGKGGKKIYLFPRVLRLASSGREDMRELSGLDWTNEVDGTIREGARRGYLSEEAVFGNFMEVAMGWAGGASLSGSASCLLSLSISLFFLPLFDPRWLRFEACARFFLVASVGPLSAFSFIYL
jgi:hypothetical protein